MAVGVAGLKNKGLAGRGDLPSLPDASYGRSLHCANKLLFKSLPVQNLEGIGICPPYLTVATALPILNCTDNYDVAKINMKSVTDHQ